MYAEVAGVPLRYDHYRPLGVDAPAPAIVLLAVFGSYALWSPVVWVWRRIRRLKRLERKAPGDGAA